MGEPLRFALTQAEIERACGQFAYDKHDLEGDATATTRLRIDPGPDGHPKLSATVEILLSKEEP